jgi:DNA-binding NarL/FixJ family response regulator
LVSAGFAAEAGAHEQIRVVLVDDHDVFRSGLRHLLENEGFDVVGEAGDGWEALRTVPELLPDVVLMDINMPGMGGVEVTERLTAVAPLVRVVILSISADELHVTDAIMAGACGYLLKDARVETLAEGIRAAAAGESLISPSVAAQLLARFREQAAASVRPEGIERDLTVRELEVLRLVAQGKENAAIAQLLFLSPKTVKNHISSILRKLQMENRIQVAIYAVQSGLV